MGPAVRQGDGRPAGVGARVATVRRTSPESATGRRHFDGIAALGVLALRVAASFTPERSADAHRQMEAGGLRGHAVIVFD